MGYLSLMPSFVGNLLTQQHQIWSQKETTLSYGNNPESRSQLGLIRYRVLTDGRTDGRTEL